MLLSANHHSDADDTDMMSFEAAAGTVYVMVPVLPAASLPGSIMASTFPTRMPRSNLFMRLEVRNSKNEVLLTSTGVGIDLVEFSSPARDTYYVSVTGLGKDHSDAPLPVGEVQPNDATSFSSYGSRGQYILFLYYKSTGQ